MVKRKKVFGEVLIKKPKEPRVLPESILLAKELAIKTGDFSELRRLGSIGNARYRQMRAAEKEEEAKLAAKKEADEIVALKIAAEFLSRQMRQVSLRDAKRHAAATRAGWDDNYDPSDEDVVWFN
jgi:hypothetical protein